MRIIATLCAGTLIGCGASAPRRPMQLQRVVLYQNGIGHFERTGHMSGETLRLDFPRRERDDVLKTLTVIDRLGAGVATVDIPNLDDSKTKAISLGVRMSAGATCSSGRVAPSHVLAAMGADPGLAAAALRASFGWSSTIDDVHAAVESLVKLAERANRSPQTDRAA